jgi:chromosome segregation ATPase
LSTLGKIFTVLNVVAAIALCVLVVAYVRSDAEMKSERDRALAGQDSAVRAVSVFQEALGFRNDDMAKMQEVNRTDLEAKVAEIKRLNVQLAADTSDKSKADAHLADLTNSLKAAQGLLAEANTTKADWESKYTKEVSAGDVLRKANTELQTLSQDLKQQKLELLTRVKDLDLQVSEAVKENKFLKQHAQAALPTAVPVLPTVDLHGVIKEADNQTKIASINLGSSDQVVQNMTFVISRGSNFVAELVITKVDENSAVGRLETVTSEVRRDDNVTYTVRH